jgi:hypothetical protein
MRLVFMRAVFIAMLAFAVAGCAQGSSLAPTGSLPNQASGLSGSVGYHVLYSFSGSPDGDRHILQDRARISVAVCTVDPVSRSTHCCVLASIAPIKRATTAFVMARRPRGSALRHNDVRRQWLRHGFSANALRDNAGLFPHICLRAAVGHRDPKRAGCAFNELLVYAAAVNVCPSDRGARASVAPVCPVDVGTINANKGNFSI